MRTSESGFYSKRFGCMSSIKKRTLGKTGQSITEVSFGSVFITNNSGTNKDDGIRVVQRALKLGVNYIDTSPFYHNSHEVLGEALKCYKGDYILGTKCGRWDFKTGPYRDIDAFKVQFEKTLNDLHRESVDILYIHEADWAVYWEEMEIPRTKLEIDLNADYDYAASPVAQFLQWAKDQGLTRYLGISGNNAHLMAKVLKEINLDIDVVLMAYAYSLIWRNAKEYLLPLTNESGAGVIIGTPLQQGRLSVPHKEWIEKPPEWMNEDTRKRFKALYDIQIESGLSLAELAMRFILADPDITAVIPGAATIEQLEENIRCSAAGPLPAELHEKLDKLGKVFPGIYGRDY